MSSSRASDAPNTASRRLPALRQASPWAALPSAPAATARHATARPVRRLMPTASATAAQAAITMPQGAGRAPPVAAPTMSAAAIGTIGAGRFEGELTVPGGGTGTYSSRGGVG
jgi:hypothetical protein